MSSQPNERPPAFDAGGAQPSSGPGADESRWAPNWAAAGDPPDFARDGRSGSLAGIRRRPGSGLGRGFELGWGVILLAAGTWFFLDVTLGLNMPRIAWAEIWPLMFIVFGGVILVRAAARRDR